MAIKLYNLNTICIAFVQIFWTGSQQLHALKKCFSGRYIYKLLHVPFL